MEILKEYFHPFAKAQEQMAYGLCAYTHFTESASKIQNVALKVLLVMGAVLFDATIGCGIVGTLFYNLTAFLYNCYGRVKHSYQKYRGVEENPWNPIALKTWTFVALGVLFLTTVYFKVWKKPECAATQAARVPVFSGVFPSWILDRRMVLSFFVGSFCAFIGMDFLRSYLRSRSLSEISDMRVLTSCLGDFSKEERIPLEAIHYTKRQLMQDPPRGEIASWVYDFGDSPIRFISALVEKYSKEVEAIRKKHQLEKTDPWQDGKFIVAADCWMKTSYTLSFLALKSLEDYAKKMGKSPGKIMRDKSSPLLHFCLLTLKNYRSLRFDLVTIEHLGNTFYKELSLEGSWRILYNDLCERLLSSRAMQEWKDEDLDYFEILTQRDHTRHYARNYGDFKDWTEEERRYFHTSIAQSIREKIFYVVNSFFKNIF